MSDQTPASEGQGQTLPSTSGTQPNAKPVRPETAALIAELGFRYPPASATDLERHAHTLRLLAQDLSHVPVRWLELAIGVWIQASPYMPKASDLLTGARSARENSLIAPIGKETMAERGNRMMSELGYKRGLAWIDDGNGGAYLEQVAEDKTVRN